MAAEVPGDTSGLSTAELFAEIGTRDHNLQQSFLEDFPDLQSVSLTARVSGFPEYQHPY
jgi:hypothetical protein